MCLLAVESSATPAYPHATYAAAVRGADGRVDTDAQVARLQDLGVGAYYWLVALPQDWDDLLIFAPKAKAAGIDVWPYLLPPSESPPFTTTYSEPHRLDYFAWGEAIARASLAHDNIPGWIIDDFYANHALFTPDYMREVQRRMKAINPKLKFFPLMYFNEIDAAFVAAYRDAIDGVVIAYPQDREDVADARAVLRGMTPPVRNQMRLQNATATNAGDYVAITQRVEVLPGASAAITFREFDDFFGSTADYHFKQVLLDDTVVWEADVAGLPRSWRDARVDVSALVQGKPSVDLTFRIFEKKGVSNFGVRWRLDALRAEGLRLSTDFDAPEAWDASVQGPFDTGFGKAVREETPKFEVPFVVMTAGQEVEFRLRHDDPASPERIAQWLQMCLEAQRDGLCDGVVTYALDLDPARDTFQRVRALFLKH